MVQVVWVTWLFQYAKEVNAHVIEVDISNDKLALAKEIVLILSSMDVKLLTFLVLIKKKQMGGAHILLS